MFWDYFRSRTNGSYSEQLGSVLGPSRTANVNDRNNIVQFNRQGGPTQVTQGLYGPNGFSQARPPHHPGPQANQMAQSPAALASRSRAAAASSSRNTRAPYVSIGSPTAQEFGLDVDNGIQGLNVSEAIGQLMAGSPNNQRPGVSGVDVQGAAIANMGGQLRSNAQPGRPGASAAGSQNTAFMSSLGDISKNRMSNVDSFATSNRRASAETSPHLRLGNAQDDDALLHQRAGPAMHGSKKRLSSASVSLDSLQTGAVASSSGLAPGAFAKNASSGPKKRMRNSASFPSEFMSMSQTQPSAIQAQNQARMHQLQPQQKQQLGRATNLQTVHHLQQQQQQQQQNRIRAASMEGFAQHQQTAQQSQQERARGMRPDAHRRSPPPPQFHTIFQQYPQHPAQTHQHAQQAQQQKVALSGQEGRPGQAQNRNKFVQLGQNLQTGTPRQNTSKLVQQHRNLGQNGNSDNVQMKVDSRDGPTQMNMDTFKQIISGTGQANVAADANVRGSGQVPQSNIGMAGEPFSFYMPSLQNGNQGSNPNSRQSPNARQRHGYSARGKPTALGNRGTSMTEATAQSRGMQAPESIASSANAMKDGRRSGAPPVSFPHPLNQNGRESSLPRNIGAVQSSASIATAEMLQKPGLFSATQRERANASNSNGVRENGVPNAKTSNPVGSIYPQQAASSRQHGRKNGPMTQSASLMPSFTGVQDANGENLSTKSDRLPPNSQGGGTPSQRSVASGASAGAERRSAKSSGTTRKPRTTRGRRPKGDRNAVGAASPSASSRRAAATSMEQASLSSVGDNRGGTALLRADNGSAQTNSRKSPKGRDRNASGAKTIEGQRQASVGTTASNQSGRNGPAQSKKRTTKQRLAQQQMAQKHPQSMQQQQKQQSQIQQQKNHLDQKKQGLQQLPPASQPVQVPNAQIDNPTVLQARKQLQQAPPKQKSQARQSQVGSSAAALLVAQVQPKTPGQLGTAPRPARAQTPLDDLAHAQPQTAQGSAFDRAHEVKDGAIGTSEFYDPSVNLGLDKGYVESHFLSAATPGAQANLTGFHPILEDMDSGIGSMLDMPNMNGMDGGLGLDTSNGFEDEAF